MSELRGGCFGFGVYTDLDLRYLREAGLDPLEVVEGDENPAGFDPAPIREWMPREDRPVHARIHANGVRSRFGLWIADAGWYVVVPGERRIEVPPSGRNSRREERLWGIPAILSFLERGDVPLHAAVVDIGGQAVAFGAPSRHGKTTLAAAFWRSGFRLMSEDLTCIRWDEGPMVLPGPAMLRPRIDVADRLELNEVLEIDRDDDRVHLVLDGPRGSDHSAVPLSGFVFLREASDRIALDRSDLTDTIRDLFALTFHLGVDEHERRMFENLTDLATKVPAWDLHRPITLDALDGTVEAIVEMVGS